MAFVEAYLRHDQTVGDIGKKEYQDDKVKVYAPIWVQHAIHFINQRLNLSDASSIRIMDKFGSSTQYKLSFPLNLIDLITLSRNQPRNVSGEIDLKLYRQLTKSPEIIYSLKDIVRHVIMIGLDETVAYGGYPEHIRPQTQNCPVVIIDMIGLQFQQKYNSGRLVLIAQNLPKGILDDFIYHAVVGEQKISYQNALRDYSGRYVNYNDVIFDTKAYELFVANDLLLACISLNKFANFHVKLRFLKYGTGFFAGPFLPIVDNHIYHGIAIGLRKFFEGYDNKVIRKIEFPFYKKNDKILEICRQYGVDCRFTMDDALRQNDSTGLLIATTNCSDPHAMPGNEMGYSSVDASIAQNLLSKAFKFNPAINLRIGVNFIDFNHEKKKSKSNQNTYNHSMNLR